MVRLNRKIILRSYSATQNVIGGPVADETGAWEMWAQVEDRQGSQINTYNQGLWNYDYKITVRYERDRVIGSNFLINYGSKLLKIRSVSFENEAHRHWTVLRCEAIDSYVAAGPGGTVVPLPRVKEYVFEATSITNTFAALVLVGKNLFDATKDGVRFEIITTGTPGTQQVKIANGITIWPTDFEIGEKAIITYV